jgi:hypothetical protein
MLVLTLAIVLAALAGGGCGPAPPPAAPKKEKVESTDFDPCKDSPPAKKTYSGILKHIKCDQDLYLTMADVSGDLNVECDYCHVHDKSDEKKFNFPIMTDRKQVALFMNHEFMEGLKQKDGKPMKCGSCHVDKNGKPAAKFLGEPRDIPYTLEWMNLVMVNKFTHVDGSKVKCRDCHGGNYKTADFKPKVILVADQVKLPGVAPFSLAPDNPPADPMLPPVKPNAKPQGQPPTQWWKKQ